MCFYVLLKCLCLLWRVLSATFSIWDWVVIYCWILICVLDTYKSEKWLDRYFLHYVSYGFSVCLSLFFSLSLCRPRWAPCNFPHSQCVCCRAFLFPQPLCLLSLHSIWISPPMCLCGPADNSPSILEVHRSTFLLQMLANVPVALVPLFCLHPSYNEQVLGIAL